MFFFYYNFHREYCSRCRAVSCLALYSFMPYFTTETTHPTEDALLLQLVQAKRSCFELIANPGQPPTQALLRHETTRSGRCRAPTGEL